MKHIKYLTLGMSLLAVFGYFVGALVLSPGYALIPLGMVFFGAVAYHCGKIICNISRG